jgi:hypothetical protein
MGFDEEVKAAIDLLGAQPRDAFVDLLADPGRGCQALDALAEGEGVVIRAAPELGAAAPGYAPPPVDPVWVRVMRGAREVGTASLRGDAGQVRRARRVDLDERPEPCCDAPGCERRKVHAAAWLVLEPREKKGPDERLLVAEQRVDEGQEPDDARAAASRLADALDVPIERGGEALEIAKGPAPEPVGPPLPPGALARYGIRSEGDERVVLRDLASAGPRTSASRTLWIGVALALVAAMFWYQLARALGAGGERGAAIAYGTLGALFSIATYAFLGVARFAARYTARSSPLVAVGRDRLVVLPWVSRDGAVDLGPEGRLGAAIPLGEVRAASVAPRADRWAVELDTDHGPIDALVADGEDAAALWCAALDRAIEEARHPRAGATARQRARQRAPA